MKNWKIKKNNSKGIKYIEKWINKKNKGRNKIETKKNPNKNLGGKIEKYLWWKKIDWKIIMIEENR